MAKISNKWEMMAKNGNQLQLLVSPGQPWQPLVWSLFDVGGKNLLLLPSSPLCRASEHFLDFVVENLLLRNWLLIFHARKSIAKNYSEW